MHYKAWVLIIIYASFTNLVGSIVHNTEVDIYIFLTPECHHCNSICCNHEPESIQTDKGLHRLQAEPPDDQKTDDLHEKYIWKTK